MPAHEFRQRVHDDVGTVIDRAQQNGSGDRVVHDQWNAMPVGNVRQCFDIADVACRIPHAFAEDCSRVFIYQPSPRRPDDRSRQIEH